MYYVFEFSTTIVRSNFFSQSLYHRSERPHWLHHCRTPPHNDFKKWIDSVIGLTLHPNSEFAKDPARFGAKIVSHKPGRVKDIVKTLRDSGADTLGLILPAHENKLDLTTKLVEAVKKVNVPNVCFISSAGNDLLNGIVSLDCVSSLIWKLAVLSCKGDSITAQGHSPVVIQ